MDVKLYGPESGEMMGLTPEYIEAITQDETIMKVMDIFAYHSYHDDNNPAIRLDFKKQIVEKHPEFRFDMSEWCELPNKSHTKDFKGALITARIIGQDLIYAGAESWTSWVAVNQFSIKEDGNDYSDATITATNNFEEWYVARRYWGFAHFAKYIPVGSVCLDNGFFPDENNDFNVFSFLTPNGETVTVVVNEGEERGIEIYGNYTEMKVIQSVDEDYLNEIYNGKFKDTITVKQNSILTVITK